MRQWPRTRFVLVGSLVALQALDFVVTWQLLSGGVRSDIYEANPLARFILNTLGWGGLALFKASVTALALGAVLYVARERPRTAQFLLMGLCLMVLVVVGQGGRLLASTNNITSNQTRILEQRQELLVNQMQSVADFTKSRDAILVDLLEGRIDQESAIAQIVACINAHRPKLDSFQKKNLPPTDQIHHVASYVYFHLVTLARIRDRSADLSYLGQDLTDRIPGVVLLEPGTLHSFDLPWRQ